MSLASRRALHVIAYHYVRDLSRTQTPFARLHALGADDFRSQLGALQAVYEMADLESAVAFLNGRYQPRRDLCLLTFDDGLRDHFEEVFPSLRERRIQGIFFLITSCLEGRLSSVHQSHFLMASLGLDEYRRRVTRALKERPGGEVAVDSRTARATYRWDTPDTAEFKYLVNFMLAEEIRDSVLGDLFDQVVGDREEFARRLYLNWSEAAAMQADRMIAGGHTHLHRPLARLTPGEQLGELTTCTTLLRHRLPNQALWPFSFPYGKADSFDRETLRLLNDLGYDCAFTTIPGSNHPGIDRFMLRRIDPKEMAAGNRSVPAPAISTDGAPAR